MDTIKNILSYAVEYLNSLNIPSARLDSEIILAHILNKDRTYLFSNPESRISNPESRKFKEIIERRGKREPVSYITGEKEFWSLKFKVTRDTLIPRPETEILVQAVLDIVRGMNDERRRTKTERRGTKDEGRKEATIFSVPRPSSLVILDIGTGCGNIPISLALESPESHIFTIDRSDAALSVAKENAITHRVAERITFLKGDLFNFQFKDYFDIIVSNPPYIPSGDIETLMPDVKDWEPRGALDGGEDGLDAIRKIIVGAPGLLKPQGHLAMEIGFDQAEDVRNIIKLTDKFSDIRFVKDLAGIQRIVVATLRQDGQDK